MYVHISALIASNCVETIRDRCSHAVVVVALGAELLATELEGGDLGGCGNDS